MGLFCIIGRRDCTKSDLELLRFRTTRIALSSMPNRNCSRSCTGDHLRDETTTMVANCGGPRGVARSSEDLPIEPAAGSCHIGTDATAHCRSHRHPVDSSARSIACGHSTRNGSHHEIGPLDRATATVGCESYIMPVSWSPVGHTNNWDELPDVFAQ